MQHCKLDENLICSNMRQLDAVKVNEISLLFMTDNFDIGRKFY